MILTTLARARLQASYAAGFWRDTSIYDYATAHAGRSPGSFLIRDYRHRLTYAEAVTAADRLAMALQQSGLVAGDRVGLWTSGRVDTLIVWLACSRNGYVCCPSLHRTNTVDEVYTLMTRLNVSAFIGEHGWGAGAATSPDIFGRLRSLGTIRWLRELDARDSVIGLSDETRACDPSRTEPDRTAHDPNDVVYIAFTSGTSGDPKAVMHSDNTLLSNARSLSADWDFHPGSVLYTLSPLSHNLGVGAMLCAVVSGAELVVHDVPRSASLIDRLREVGATFLFGVPTHAIDLLEEARRRGVGSLAPVTGFRISGAAASKTLFRDLAGYGVTPQSGYGMTEGCSHHYTLPSDSLDRVMDTSGRACRGYEVKVWSLQDRDCELPAGQSGEIGGRGASLMLGYFDDQRSTERAFNAAAWFMTGDIGYLRPDGYLVITGRKKDIIVRGGRNIQPSSLENVAMQYPSVLRAAAIGVPDERLGERICLVVACAAGVCPDAVELVSFLGDAGVSRYDLPELFLQIDQMPLTASGKVLKRALADRILRGEYSPVRVGPQAPHGGQR